MSVPVEGETVLVRNETLRRKYVGGVDGFARDCPNATFCTDESLCRVSFMTGADAIAFLEQLGARGLEMPSHAGSPDTALVRQGHGLVEPCDWVELAVAPIEGVPIMMAWTGDYSERFVGPPGWRPRRMTVATREQLARHAFVETRDQIDVYRDADTGEEIYVARTRAQAPPAHVDPADVERRFTELIEALTAVGGFGPVRAPAASAEVEAALTLAQKLVADTGEGDARAFQLLGIAERRMGFWGEAADSFCRAAQLRPDSLEPWLERTAALAHLQRFEEAEDAARRAVATDPRSPRALGNLASVLWQQGRHNDAWEAIERALEAEPHNAVNLAIRQRLQEAGAEPQRPWWKKIF